MDKGKNSTRTFTLTKLPSLPSGLGAFGDSSSSSEGDVSLTPENGGIKEIGMNGHCHSRRVGKGEKIEGKNGHRSVSRAKTVPNRGMMMSTPKDTDRKENNLQIGTKKFLGIPIEKATPLTKLYKLHSLLLSLSKGEEPMEQVKQYLTKYLLGLKIGILGDKVTERMFTEREFLMMTDAIIDSGFLSTLIIKYEHLGFEEQKMAALILANLLRRPGSESRVVQYIEDNRKLLFFLIDGYRKVHMALNCGVMLRECMRHERLAKALVQSDYLLELFELMNTDIFIVTMDCCKTLYYLMDHHAKHVAEFVQSNYAKVFAHIDKLLLSGNYATRITTLQLLSNMMRNRNFYEWLNVFTNDPPKLKRIILMMDTDQKKHQLGAYHVFKIFLANPDPPEKIRSMLLKNRVRLMNLLETIKEEKNTEDFEEEMAFLLRQLTNLDKTARGSDSAGSASVEADGADN